MVLYIHGFSSNGEGSKAQSFRDYFKSIDEPYFAPSLSNIPDLAIKTLEEIIQTYNEEIYLIGSSLGGFYATYLADKYGLKTVLINPSIFPYKTLNSYVGLNPNFYDNSSFEWKESHLEMLKKYEVTDIDEKLFTLFIQKGDELLNFQEAVDRFKNAKVFIEDGGSHRFDNIEKYYHLISKLVILRD